LSLTCPDDETAACLILDGTEAVLELFDLAMAGGGMD
jgi:hypothetical protein